MDRREALRLLATGTALQLAPRSLLAAMREARKLLDASSVPRTLNAHQHATVKAMAELIIPRTETPGASDVGAGEFIDLILTEWYDEEERTRFLTGLADVDLRTKTLFGTNFVDAIPSASGDPDWLGQKMTEDGDATPRPRPRSTCSHPELLCHVAHLTFTAYYTSEAGATQELHFEMIPGFP